MATKLTEITSKYHKFVDNQVLTKDQLNEFIDYFDDQDRISRVFLHGTGIVCGFQLTYNSTASKIAISQGTGITTDGDIIKLKSALSKKPEFSIQLNEIEYSHYKLFEDDNARYPFFRKKIAAGTEEIEKLIQMWELSSKPIDNSTPLKNFTNLSEMVVLIYLESYSKFGDLCTAIDCDNQGNEQVSNLRVLLVSKEDAEYIASKDSIFSKYNIADKFFELPKPAIRKVILSTSNSSKYENLKQAYLQAIVKNGVVNSLSKGINSIVQNFGELLQANISDADLSTTLNQISSLVNIKSFLVPFDIQYRYDFLKDVTDTYNELKTLLLSLQKECNPDITAFPKHLLLGQLNEINSENKHLRHNFYPAPTHIGNENKIEQAKNLLQRLFEIINGFQIQKGEIKITPSNKLKELSFRAIPFYYDLNSSLLSSWNFFKTQKNEEDQNLSYHTDVLSDELHIQEPLAFNTDRFDFYRIEGHQGQDYQTALEKIDDLKKQYGLAFDVKALSVNINNENLNIDDYECEFEELKVMLRAWTAEQNCVLAEVSNFFSSFSTSEPGKNDKETELGIAKIENPATGTSSRLLTNTASLISQPKESFTINTNFTQPAYKVNNVVSENLNTKENTLGIVMNEAIISNKNGSVNDIIAAANIGLADKLNTDVWKEQSDLKEFVIDNSVKLMAYTHVITQRMPDTIAAVDVSKIDSYKLSLVQLCELVKKLKAKYQSTELSLGLKSFMGLLINQLSTVCCSGKKLEVLLEEVNKRKESILLRLQLSKFVENHSGLEHLAGVQPGGTFVLVYLNKEKVETQDSSTSATNIARSNLSLLSTKEVLSNELSTTNKLSSVSSGIRETSALSINREKLISGVSIKDGIIGTGVLGKFIPQPEIPNNTVVADFALPYMCCSDCAPVNFIVQKKPATLRLEKDQYCLGKDSETISFDVSPLDGIVKSTPETEGLKITEKTIEIIPELFSERLIGQIIQFTVNDQITDAELTVYKMGTFDFKVPESPTSETKITFIPSGELDGVTFNWDFGDGQTSIDRNPTHQYKLPVNEKNTVEVSLTVIAANGVCRNTVTHTIQFNVEESISLDKLEYCSNDSNGYPFIVTPEDSTVKINGSGVSAVNNQFIFTPSTAIVGKITFVLNGTLSDLSVKVQPAPLAIFDIKQVQNQLIISNFSKNANLFVWVINKKIIEKNDLSPITIDLTPNSPTTWKIKLVATGEKVCKESVVSHTGTTKFIEDPTTPNNCIEETKASIVSDSKNLSKLMSDGNFITPLWQSTSKLYGGTSTFSKGVLNQIDEFLSGERNPQLNELFNNLLKETAKSIVSIDRLQQKKEFNALVQLFELQLQLFYNILACQNTDILLSAESDLGTLLELIPELLRTLKNREIIFSDFIKAFIEKYPAKVNDVDYLVKHIEFITANKLI